MQQAEFDFAPIRFDAACDRFHICQRYRPKSIVKIGEHERIAWKFGVLNILCSRYLQRLIDKNGVVMSPGNVIPILRVFDENKTREFYIDFLGFKVDWEHRFEDDLPLYMQVSKGDCVLHLSEHHGDSCPGSAMRIEVEDLDSYQRELVQKQYKNARPGIQDQPWGTRDMSINDPFGNRLVFTNAIST